MSNRHRIPGLLAGLLAGAVAVTAADQPPPPAAVTPPLPLTPDKADRFTARANREALESGLLHGGTIVLGPGVYTLDRAVMLTPDHSGATLKGAGLGRTVLRNAYTPAPYWQNETVSAQGGGVGYVDHIQPVGPNWFRIKPGGYDPSCYEAGRVVYFWRWNGWWFPDGKGTGPTRRRVAALDAKSGVVTLDGPIPEEPFAGGVKWLDGCPIADCVEGAVTLTCESAADAATFPVGSDVMVTDGPSLANEAAGEFRSVASVDAAKGTVTLDRPLRRGFRQAALVRIKAVADVTLCDLTLARPVNGQAEAGLFKFCRGLRLERVRVEGALSLASCWDMALTDAAVPDGLALNNCHDVWVRGGRYGSVWGEEGVHDLTLDGLRVVCPTAAGPDRNGIGQGIEGGCERWTLRGVRVEGFPNSPIGLIGRENVVTDVTVAGSRAVAQPGNCYLQGDRLRVVGLRSDRPVVFLAGRGMSVAHVRAPWVSLGWVQGGPASGTAIDCGEKVTVRNPEWKVWPPTP